MTEKDKEEEKVEAQFVDSTVTAFVIQSAIKSIIGYLAVWLFRPIWEKITNKFSKKD